MRSLPLFMLAQAPKAWERSEVTTSSQGSEGRPVKDGGSTEVADRIWTSGLFFVAWPFSEPGN